MPNEDLIFIKCAECEKIIEVKNLNVPFTEEILEQANENNTIRGTDLCAECAAQQVQPEPEPEPEPEEPENNSAEENPVEEN